MKKQKLYLQRHYNQWKGLDIAIEEEINETYESQTEEESNEYGYGLYIQIPDLEMVKGSGTIIADFADEELNIIASIDCTFADETKRIIRVEMPKVILANSGVYCLSLTLAYNSKGTESKIEKSAIQTFTILDTIEFSEEEIANDDRYSMLTELLAQVKEEEVDISIFAKTEDVEQMIEEALNGVDMDTIIIELENRGLYITPEELEAKLNTVLNYYVQKARIEDYLKDYAKNADLTKKLSEYATKTLLTSTLGSYVLKEDGKTLTTNDFTTVLKTKLENLPEDGNYDDTELRKMIATKATYDYVDDKITSLNTVNKEDYYDKTAIDEYVNTHNKDILEIKEDIINVESNIENSYLKKEDYLYSDGIQTDDITVGEKTLTDLLEELSYKEIEIKSFNTTLISHLYEFNVDSLSSITLHWELSDNPISQSINIYNDTLQVDTREITITTNISTDTDIILTVIDKKGIEKTATIPIRFVFPSYYGTYDETLSLTLGDIEDKNKLIMNNDKNITIDMSYTNKKIFFAYPKDFGELIDIKDNNGLSYFNDFVYNGTDYSANGTEYNVYLLDEKATCKNISYSLIFKKEEE